MLVQVVPLVGRGVRQVLGTGYRELRENEKKWGAMSGNQKLCGGREGSTERETEREAMKITGGVAEKEDKRMREINGQVVRLNSDVGERERERITSGGYTMLPSLPVSASGDFGEEEGLLMSV